MKTAFIFPGQGAQVAGMGADVAGAYSEAAEIYKRADEIVGFELSKLCFDGPQETLNATAISQPAIFVTSAAILEVIINNTDLQPCAAAGLSLGEYTALYAAGVLSFEDALRLVQKRGQAMQDAADTTDGSMVSIIGLDEEKVRELCDAARGEGEVLEPVNFNCPGQIVVSGSKAACKKASQLAESFGAMKAVELSVAGAFHTELMASAAEELAQAINESEINAIADVKIIANINAEFYADANQISDGLVKQLTGAILWEKCMERLLADGVEDFYEIGPGKVLTGLMRRINRKTKVVNVSNLQAVENLPSKGDY